MFLQQFLPDRAFETGRAACRLVTELFKENLPSQRITVRVQAARFDADHYVAALHRLLPVEHPGFFHHAHDRAADVIFTRLVKARHLRRLAADQRAVVLRAGAGETLDDLRENMRLQLARAQVIQEEQRLRAQHRDVVDAMVHQIRTNGVMLVHRERDLQLGAHAVHGRHQDRLAILLQIERKQPAEPAHLAQHLTAMRGREQLRQRGFDFIAQIDVNAGGGVSFLFHAAEIKPGNAMAGEKISH